MNTGPASPNLDRAGGVNGQAPAGTSGGGRPVHISAANAWPQRTQPTGEPVGNDGEGQGGGFHSGTTNDAENNNRGY